METRDPFCDIFCHTALKFIAERERRDNDPSEQLPEPRQLQEDPPASETST